MLCQYQSVSPIFPGFGLVPLAWLLVLVVVFAMQGPGLIQYAVVVLKIR